MKLDDHFLVLAVGVLTLEEDRAQQVEAHLTKSGDGFYEYQRPRTPERFSLAAMLSDGSEVGFFEWARAIRAEGVISAGLLPDLPQDRPDFPSRVQVAFAGVQTAVLCVLTRRGSVIAPLQLVAAPMYWLSPRELFEVIEQQPHRDALKQRLLEKINESNELNGRPAVKLGELLAFMQSREGASQFDLLGSDLLGSLQGLSRKLGTPLRIPEALADRFTSYPDPTTDGDEAPDFLDEEAKQEWIPQGKRLYLAPNPHRWNMYVFVPVRAPGAALPETPDARTSFIAALKKAQTLANRMQSPFEGAFRLARLVLEREKVPQLASAAAEEWGALLMELGFTEQAPEVIRRRLDACDDYRRGGISEDTLRNIVAADVADVFGGMGSWNDESPPQELYEEYQQVSSELFEAQRRFFCASVRSLGPAA